MPSTRRISAPSGRIYKSNLPKKQTTLVTPTKSSTLATPITSSVKKNFTYGKSTSTAKTTLNQIWGWEKIINDAPLKKEDQDLSREQLEAVDGSIQQQNTKRACDDDDYDDDDYDDDDDDDDTPGKIKLDSKKRKSIRRKTINDIDLELVGTQSSKAKSQKLKNGRRKITVDDSAELKIKPRSSARQVSGRSLGKNNLERSNENDYLLKEELLRHDYLNSSLPAQSPGDIKSTTGYLDLSSRLEPSPSRKEGNKNIDPHPHTPQANLCPEIPPTQSPATPISLLNRDSTNLRAPQKEVSHNTTPIPFKLSKKSKIQGLSSPEIKDTYVPSTDFSPGDPRSSVLSRGELSSNSEIKDTYDPGIDFSITNDVRPMSSKPCSPLKFVKFGLPKNFTPISSSSLKRKEFTKSGPRNFSFSPKDEILDSEAESDQEFEASSQIPFDKGRSYGEISDGKDREDINKKSLTPSCQNISPEPMFKTNSASAIISGRNESENMYGDTIGPETQLELFKLSNNHLVLEEMCNEMSFNKKTSHSEALGRKNTDAGSFSELCEEQKDDFFEETQYMETQRLSTQLLAQMEPRTSLSDIFMSIDPQRVTEILTRDRDHETRRYKLPPPVRRAWLYERSPISAVKYMAEISPAKRPGDIIDERGVGNKAFNARKSTTSWAAYEIIQLYELADPLSLEELKEKEWLKTAPKPLKWTKIPPAVVDELIANIKSSIFDTLSCDSPRDQMSKSQIIQIKNSGQSNLFENSSKFHLKHSMNNYSIQAEQTSSCLKSGPENELPTSSQATTVDLTQVQTPRYGSIDIVCETPTQLDLPSISSRLSSLPSVVPSSQIDQNLKAPFSMASSQLLTKSQLLPDSLLNGFTLQPPPILPSSECDGND